MYILLFLALSILFIFLSLNKTKEGFIPVKKAITTWNRTKRSIRLSLKKLHDNYIYPSYVKLKKMNK